MHFTPSQLAHEQMVAMLQKAKRELEQFKAKLEDSVERLRRTKMIGYWSTMCLIDCLLWPTHTTKE